jgi:hypothetical protein
VAAVVGPATDDKDGALAGVEHFRIAVRTDRIVDKIQLL